MWDVKLPCLSLRQPWAELVLNPETNKDIENRRWNTKLRGPFLIHAAKGMTGEEFDEAMWFANEDGGVSLHVLKYILPDVPRGGIVGAGVITSVIQPFEPDLFNEKKRRWHMGAQYGFTLGKRVRLPFRPYRGALGFFQVELTADEERALREAGLV